MGLYVEKNSYKLVLYVILRLFCNVYTLLIILCAQDLYLCIPALRAIVVDRRDCGRGVQEGGLKK